MQELYPDKGKTKDLLYLIRCEIGALRTWESDGCPKGECDIETGYLNEVKRAKRAYIDTYFPISYLGDMMEN